MLCSELPDLGRLSVFLEAVRSLFFGTFQFRFKQSIKVSVFKISVSLFFVGTERVSYQNIKVSKKVSTISKQVLRNESFPFGLKRKQNSQKLLETTFFLLFCCHLSKNTFFVLLCPSAITVKKKQSKSKQLCEITCFCFHVLKSPIFSLKKKKQPTLLVCKTFVLVNDGKKTPSFCLNQFFCGFFFTKSVGFGVTRAILLHQKTEIFKKLFWLLMSVKEE